MKDKKIVVKFGGSNLKKKEDIGRIAQAVKLYRQPIVIVVSALYGVTDMLIEILHKAKTDESAIEEIKSTLLEAHGQLIDLYIENQGKKDEIKIKILQRIEELEKYFRGIHYLGEVPDFVEDRVLSYGERLSSLVLTALLNSSDIQAEECLPEKLGLYTNGEFRNAAVDFNLSCDNVKQALSGDRVYVIPGFYGLSPDSRVTLLGRGGSDYTAAAIARCIDAASVDLWKDVPGFMTADPKLVSNTAVIQKLTYSEAAELSYFGARILHPRTFEPVSDRNISIRLFNIYDFDEKLEPVTVINHVGVIKDDVIKSVTFSDDFAVLRLRGAGVGIKPGIMAKVTTRLNDERINIKSIITAQTSINLLLSRDDLAAALRIAKQSGLAAVEEIDGLDDI